MASTGPRSIRVAYAPEPFRACPLLCSFLIASGDNPSADQRPPSHEKIGTSAPCIP